MRAVVQLVALVDVLDQGLARLGMRDRPEPGLQVIEQRPDVLGRHAALAAAAP